MHDQHRLEAAEHTVGAPVVRELDGRAFEVAAVLFELGFEAGEQRKRIGGGPGKPGENPIVVESPDLRAPLLHDRLAERDLPVARHDRLVAMSNGQHGRGVEIDCGTCLVFSFFWSLFE